MVKKIKVCFIVIMMLLWITGSVQAASGDTVDGGYKSDFTGLVGNVGRAELNYQLLKNVKFTSDLEDYVLRAGFRFQVGDWLGLKVGERYNQTYYDNFFQKQLLQEYLNYGGLDFSLPLGDNNLRLAGFYDYNYAGKDWARYETAIRIEMYEGQYIFAGVRGDTGVGFTQYKYNPSGEPLFFLRGDFNWQWGKVGLNLQPLLYVTGDMLLDTSLKYNFNERTSMVLNFNNIYDYTNKYRIGVQYKF